MPCSSSVSPSINATAPTSSPRRCTANTTRSPLSVTMPGKTRSPASADRGGITTSATPGPPVQQGLFRMVELVLRDQRPRVPAEVGSDRARRPRGQQPLPEQQDDRHRPEHQRHPDQREREEPEPVAPGHRVGDDHVHGRPGQRQQRPGVRGERQRQHQLRGRAPRLHGQHDGDGHQRRHRPVHVQQRGQPGRQRHRHHDQPRPAPADPGHQLLPHPRRHPRQPPAPRSPRTARR